MFVVIILRGIWNRDIEKQSAVRREAEIEVMYYKPLLMLMISVRHENLGRGIKSSSTSFRESKALLTC